jgi:hypothetical protein
MKQHNITDCLSLETTNINTNALNCNTGNITSAVIINMNINGFLLKSPSNVARCKLFCDSGVWTMPNRRGFRSFYGGLYVQK